MQSTKPESRRLTDAQRELVEENLGLVGYVVNTRLCVDAESVEDMFQVGVLGLMKAAQGYDSSRGVKFATFATHCIMNQIRQARRHDRTYRQRISSLELPWDTHAPDEEHAPRIRPSLAEQMDEGPPIEELAANSDMADRIKRLLDARPGQVTDMARAYLIQGMTQKEIARKWEITQPSVSRNVARTLDWLRKQLEDEGNDEHD